MLVCTLLRGLVSFFSAFISESCLQNHLTNLMLAHKALWIHYGFDFSWWGGSHHQNNFCKCVFFHLLHRPWYQEHLWSSWISFVSMRQSKSFPLVFMLASLNVIVFISILGLKIAVKVKTRVIIFLFLCFIWNQKAFDGIFASMLKILFLSIGYRFV